LPHTDTGDDATDVADHLERWSDRHGIPLD
jgi:hypothetical protein